MKLKATESSDGVMIQCPTGAVQVDLDVTKREGTLHIGDVDESIASGVCPIEGNSYPYKETIKELPYGDKGSQWTGDVWAVNPRRTADLVAMLVMEEADVTIEAACLQYDEDWGELRREIVLDEDKNESLSVVHPPYGPDNKVPRSWAEDAGRMANYTDVQEFADDFDLNIVPDKEAYDDLGLDDEDDEVSYFDTDSAT
jgi:hypothetical protein